MACPHNSSVIQLLRYDHDNVITSLPNGGTLAEFKSFVMNNKAFGNLFCNSQKSFHTSPTRIIEVIDHSSNSTMAFKCIYKKILDVKFFVNAIVEFEE